MPKELRSFIAEPESIVPHIDPDNLEKFTSTLLNKLFANSALSHAFVQSINKHKSRLSRPIMDYRVDCYASDYSDNYIKIDGTISTSRRDIDVENVTCSCMMIESGPSEMFSIDSFSEKFDFLWKFVPCLHDEDINKSEFTIKSIKVAGTPHECKENTLNNIITYTSDNFICPIDNDSVLEIEFSVLQRKSACGVSFSVSRPAKSVTITLNYKDLNVDQINIWSYLTGSRLTEPLLNRDQARKIVRIRYSDWVFIGSGIVFSWNYEPKKLA